MVPPLLSSITIIKIILLFTIPPNVPYTMHCSLARLIEPVSASILTDFTYQKQNDASLRSELSSSVLTACFEFSSAASR